MYSWYLTGRIFCLLLLEFFISMYVLYDNERGNDAGLGEMMPAQLWETTMDPEQRLLKQLVVEDAAEANIVFSSLMGARVRNNTLSCEL